MDRRWAKRVESCLMDGPGIALVPFKRVCGKILRLTTHDAIAGHFRQDRCRSDR
jgi:hypothetical protein